MRHYLDHAATTPLRPEARDAWLAAAQVIGNASSTHGAGQDARRLLEESRERAAAALGCEPIEVVFTSGGTESINLALQGLWASRAAGSRAIVLPDAEHHATMDTVGALVAAAGVPLHLDAVAALGHVHVSFSLLRGDAAPGTGLVALSAAGHKIGAPVGVGVLVTARSARISALLHGGAQQRGLRAGTQDVAGAAAFAVAVELAVAEREVEAARLSALRDRLVDGIRSRVPAAVLLGDPVDRLPGNAHLLFPGAVGESLIFLLDMAGVAVSTGSACQAGVAEPSHVVMATGRSESEARSVLRFSLGHTTTDADVDAVLAAIGDAYARASASTQR